jgi:hypothetical protein
VTHSGGLGTFAAVGYPAAVLAERLDAVRVAVGDAAFAVNFLVPFLDRDAVVEAARRARLVECFYGPLETELVELGRHRIRRRARFRGVSEACFGWALGGHRVTRGRDPLRSVIRLG